MSDLDKVLAELRFQQYALSRSTAPEITPNSWRNVYGASVGLWEVRFQAEKAIFKAAS